MSKGSQNERDLCRQFSLWWSEGLGINPPRNDIFWRTAGSGARARVRTDTGQNVFRGYGDMMAEDPIGQPLIDRCTFEFKKGYPELSIDSCIDSKQKLPKLIQFLQEVEKDARDAGNYPTLVIHRNRKKSIIGIPSVLYNDFENWFGDIKTESIIRLQNINIFHRYHFVSLQDFFNWVDSEFFLK
jgi:hypothetical protein